MLGRKRLKNLLLYFDEDKSNSHIIWFRLYFDEDKFNNHIIWFHLYFDEDRFNSHVIWFHVYFDEGKFSSHIISFQEEKRGLQDRLAQQQRVLSQIEQEKREVELTSLRIEKDRKTVKAALDKVKYASQLVP